MTGNANIRTDVKADVMQEVLGRFEAQFEKVQSTPGQASKKAPAAKRAPGKADIAMRGVEGPSRQLARTQRAATDLAQEVVQSRAATPKPAAKKPVAPSASAQSTAKTGRTRQIPDQGTARQEVCRSQRHHRAQQPQGGQKNVA